MRGIVPRGARARTPPDRTGRGRPRPRRRRRRAPAARARGRSPARCLRARCRRAWSGRRRSRRRPRRNGAPARARCTPVVASRTRSVWCGRSGHLAGRDAPHLGELLHEVLLRVEASRRVDEQASRRRAPSPPRARRTAPPTGPRPRGGARPGARAGRAHVWSCSIAPARNVSAAASSTSGPPPSRAPRAWPSSSSCRIR